MKSNINTTVLIEIKMNIYYRWRHFCLCAVFCLPFLTSCRDDYFYDNEEPEWLGKNVYDYLLDKENYTTYLTLIDQLGYREILQRTGSKTIFPAYASSLAGKIVLLPVRCSISL